MAASILHLQRLVGNDAVAKAIASGAIGFGGNVVHRQDAGDAGPGLQDADGPSAGLPEPEKSAEEKLLADFQKSQTELDDFKRTPHKVSDYQPSTGIGLFDANYQPPATLEVTLKLKFGFANGSTSDWPTTPAQLLQWTDAQKTEFQANFISTVGGAWSGQHTFYCQRDWWESLTAKVSVKVIAVEKDEHFAVNVVKIPPGEFRGSSVSSPIFEGALGGGTGDFDSEDLTPTSKAGGKQRAAVHEAGHMLGLDDEYKSDSTLGNFFAGDVDHSDLVESEFGHGVARGPDDRIMSGGEKILPEHGVTFLEALRKCASDADWSHTIKAPKPVPVAAAPAASTPGP